jgi:hypothetical protein
MRTPRVRPWRGPGPGRPAVPVPPERLAPLRGGRPLKAWTWVGAFGPEVLLCAAQARVGPARVSWWAVWERERGRLHERTTRGHGGLSVTPRRVQVDGVLDLEVGDAEAVEVISPHGRQYAWTRKRGGVPVRGWAVVDGHRLDVDAAGLVDESAGYHARHTAWRWSAGVGVAESGAPVAWNLVDGLHDAPDASERTVWVAGRAHAVGPARFGARLSGLAFAEGGSLRFSAEATRARRERMLVIRSDYEQPFGAFAGELPVAGPLREGWGVMERHDVRW